MKKSAILIITVLLFFSLAPISYAAKTVQIMINGVTKHFSQPPVIQNGTTLVPLRDMFEVLGGEVYWDSTEQTAFVHKEETCLFVQMNEEYATVADYQPGGACSNPQIVYMGAPAQILNGKTMVPLRFASEYLGANVQWDRQNYMIRISVTTEKSTLIGQENISPIDVNGRLIKVGDRVKYSFFYGEVQKIEGERILVYWDSKDSSSVVNDNNVSTWAMFAGIRYKSSSWIDPNVLTVEY